MQYQPTHFLASMSRAGHTAGRCPFAGVLNSAKAPITERKARRRFFEEGLSLDRSWRWRTIPCALKEGTSE